ncbi:hypothetical protein SBOR_1542 [Sclerotinia borealis F-4128]|uniref:3'-5' exoribonuclease Rv2179c-like domain-containing protein n=1 Tax=Sclerotinia borealis (strain F-4128) TaxID=1432307 RepID=W9CQG3_SCLBF|nr:hypothetical protein SBOR_1542 [Sclerotinia borealis F-4128]
MSAKDVRTHIMLDLEIAAHPLKHNPAIIQIGAIHFDIETGAHLNKVLLDVAFTRFTTWLSSCHKSTRADINAKHPAAKYDPTDLQIMIWAYGSTQDCRWMESAYKACDLKKPWMYYNDLCVRTYCEMAFSITGRNIRREVDKSFVGKKHNAIDDCKHQIIYLIRCRDALRGTQASANTLAATKPVPEPSRKRPMIALDDNRSRMGSD